MLSDISRRPMVSGNDASFGDDFEKDLGLLLRDPRRHESDDRERELNLYRSGSAPPTVEGSLSAVDGLFSTGGGGGGGGGAGFTDFGGGVNNVNGFCTDDDFRSDPEYLSYYYSNVNLNPRLPPPLLTREELRYAQRLKGGNSVLGGIGDRRKVNNNGGNRSLFAMPPGFSSRKQENGVESSTSTAEWGGADGLIGLPGVGLTKQKSLAEIFQDDMGHGAMSTKNTSRPASRNAFDSNAENTAAAEAELAHLRNSAGVSLPSSLTYASALGGPMSRSTTPDPQAVARAPSPCLTPIGVGRLSAADKRGISSPNSYNGVSSGLNETSDLVAALSGMSLSTNNVLDVEHQITNDAENHQNHMFGMQTGHNQHAYTNAIKANNGGSDMANSSYMKRSPTSTRNNGGGGGLPAQYHHLDAQTQNPSFANYGLAGYSLNPALGSMMAGQLGTGNLPPLFENVAAMGLSGMDSRVLAGGLGAGQNLSASDIHNLSRVGNQTAVSPLQAPYADPMYLQYLRTSEYAAQLAALNDPSLDRNFLGANSYMNLLEVQKAYLGGLLSPQKSQYGLQLGGKSGGSNHHGYYGSPTYGVGLSYPGSPLANPIIPNSPVGPGSPLRLGEMNMHYPPGMRNLGGGIMGQWRLDGGMDEGFGSSLLEEFKSNKTRCFELQEIAGHVVEFSADQYGSRFIQQKLETATTEEKNMVYQEIMPHALALMTDVFGNYVIQKFFEHGLPAQRRELAGKLFGNVLTLSLQMYGCRVIQKAIEVVALDQKIKMVQELEGHIMRCVRDQNGNHVIQKCIECVPEENIVFIVSTFFDQVVTLSTHPYGCRVIQRILEHCEDPTTQSKVMEEILSSVSMLAQDQYGNYVVQHVLEHGKPDERSVIIKELAGNIVQMSQQKFASNVVEKCLTFGGPTERQILVSEMLGTTDENEPLQAMMKDQFANYVVQKVLETCDDHQRELILSRIKVHLNALKKYTYGKHIVARVEKLVAAGERRMAAQTPNLGQMG